MTDIENPPADAELVRAWRGLTALLEEVRYPTFSRLYEDQVKLCDAIIFAETELDLARARLRAARKRL
jgi:hypothetical protein